MNTFKELCVQLVGRHYSVALLAVALTNVFIAYVWSLRTFEFLGLWLRNVPNHSSLQPNPVLSNVIVAYMFDWKKKWGDHIGQSPLLSVAVLKPVPSLFGLKMASFWENRIPSIWGRRRQEDISSSEKGDFKEERVHKEQILSTSQFLSYFLSSCSEVMNLKENTLDYPRIIGEEKRTSTHSLLLIIFYFKFCFGLSILKLQGFSEYIYLCAL